LSSVIKLTLSHLDQIVEIERVSFPQPWGRNLIQTEFENSDSIILGVLDDEKLISFAIARLLVDELHLLSIATLPERRNQGASSILIKSLTTWGLNNKATKILIEVRESNTIAKNFYLKHGFEFVYIRKSYYQDNQESALVYELIIR
jgi:ribosomal-protein-alanine N-acetyltransferase